MDRLIWLTFDSFLWTLLKFSGCNLTAWPTLKARSGPFNCSSNRKIHFLIKRQRGRCCFCPDCPNYKMYPRDFQFLWYHNLSGRSQICPTEPYIFQTYLAYFLRPLTHLRLHSVEMVAAGAADEPPIFDKHPQMRRSFFIRATIPRQGRPSLWQLNEILAIYPKKVLCSVWEKQFTTQE